MEVGFVLWVVGGLLASTIISAFWWDKFPVLRSLPIIYGLCVGFIFSFFVKGYRDFVDLLQFTAASGFGGIVMVFAIWIQAKR